jgi:hypothetical protein
MLAKALILILSLSAIVKCDQTFTLGTNGDEYIKMTYTTPQNDEDLRVVFQAKINQPIPQWKAIGVVCFPTDDLSKSLNEISNGFGFLFACLTVDVCEGYQLTPMLASSHIKPDQSMVWDRNIKDFGRNNKGFYQNWQSTFVDTVYAFEWDSDEDNDTNIPLNPEHFKCYYSFDQYFGSIRLDYDINFALPYFWTSYNV